MKLIVYPLLSARSQKLIAKTRGRWGHPYQWQPRRNLILRLAYQLGWDERRVREQIEAEKLFVRTQEFLVIR